MAKPDGSSLGGGPAGRMPAAAAPLPRCARAIIAAAVAAAFVCCTALGVRRLMSLDLGYHLAYGEQFWKAGRIVDHNAFIYTLPAADLPPGERPEPGPGCWYDQKGRYRFPNANWLTQVVMAGVYLLAGTGGLCALTAALTAGLFALTLATMRRLGVPWVVAGAALLLIAPLVHPRLNLRPEMLTYVLLVGQMFLLARPARDAAAAAIRWPTAAGLVGLQLLLVNLHSYFPLGLALTGAVFAHYLLVWLWRHVRSRGSAPAVEAARAAGRLGLVLAGQVVVCLANPWTWRLAVLPVQTLAYLRAHDIGAGAGAGAHPWAYILELRPTLGRGFPAGFRDYTLCAALALGALAAVRSAIRRRWSYVFILAGAGAFAVLTFRRNIAAGAILLVPVAAAGIWAPVARAGRRVPRRVQVGLLVALALAIGGLGIWIGVEAVRYQMFTRDGRPRLGISRVTLPLGAAEWLDRNLPGLRVWTDMTSSSTIHFFTRPHREVPILTNTWAMPVAVAAESDEYRAGQRPFNAFADRHRIDAVVLRAEWSRPLFVALAEDPAWLVCHVEGGHVVLVRAAGDLAELAENLAIRPERLDVRAFIEHHRRITPAAGTSLLPAGTIFTRLGWYDLAIAVLTEETREQPSSAQAWVRLGMAHMLRGRARLTRRDRRGRDDLAEAARCYQRALQLDPGNATARHNLGLLRRGLTRLQP